MISQLPRLQVQNYYPLATHFVSQPPRMTYLNTQYSTKFYLLLHFDKKAFSSSTQYYYKHTSIRYFKQDILE